MDEMTVLEVEKSSGGALSASDMESIGKELAKEPEVVAVWIAAEDADGRGHGRRYLQIAVMTRGRTRRSCATDILPTIDRAAARRNCRVAVTWAENHCPDYVPAKVADDLELGCRLNAGVSLVRRIR